LEDRDLLKRGRDGDMVARGIAGIVVGQVVPVTICGAN
jgi:hypothetical protein